MARERTSTPLRSRTSTPALPRERSLTPQSLPAHFLPAECPPTHSLYFPSVLPPDQLIFLVPGNPGLVEYYTSFLSHLASLVPDRTAIIGVSHAGFVKDSAYYPLETQIDHKLDILQSILRALTDDAPISSAGPGTPTRRRSSRLMAREAPKVVLVGHSMGCWVIMKMLQEIRAGNWAGSEVTGAVMLFPTITHIADSPSGVKLTGLVKVPGFATMVDSIARFFASMLPLALLLWVVQKVTGMDQENVRVTAGFLGEGVYQSLRMAQEEMQQIGEDTFPDSIWGSAKAPARTKLLLYFAQNDHWVADHRRDELIQVRGKLVGKVIKQEDDGTLDVEMDVDEEEWKPKMFICEEGVPHGFCLSHGELMAEKLAGWLQELR